MFKRLFGKPDDEPAGLSMGRFVESQPRDSETPREGTAPLELPSRKPPPNIQDLVLPETLAEEASHPQQVDLRFVLGTPSTAGKAIEGPTTLGDAQLEAIAQRVAEKLAAGLVGDRLREAVNRMVSETSERLVREEIARIHAAAGRE